MPDYPIENGLGYCTRCDEELTRQFKGDPPYCPECERWECEGCQNTEALQPWEWCWGCHEEAVQAHEMERWGA